MGQERNKDDKTRGVRRMSKTNKMNRDMLKSTHEQQGVASQKE